MSKTAALYIRVSTDMQTELSPSAQKRLMTDYAKRNDIVISNEHIFYDAGITGRKTHKRTGFNHMIAVAKQKPRPFDVILVHKFSRFARSQEDSIVYKNLLKKQCGIQVLSISEPIIEGPYGELIERIIEWMDEFYSINLGTEVFKGMSEKALKGGFQASPPLGYQICHKGEEPKIIAQEAKIIQFIFDQYVNEELSLFQLTRKLNYMGFKTRRGLDFERRSLEYILNNPLYAGYIRWNRTCSETKELKNESEWIIAKGTHQPIISEELYQAAINRYQQELKPHRSRPAETAKHWLSGLIKCSHCGRSLTASVRSKADGSKYFTFQCYGYMKGKCTVSHSISGLSLEPAVLAALEKVIHCGTVTNIIKKTAATDVDETALLEKLLEKLNDKEKRIKAAYRNGIDSLQEYHENKQLLLAEEKQLRQQLSEIKNVVEIDPPHNPAVAHLTSVYNMIQADHIPDYQKNQALKSIINRIVYHRSDHHIEIYYCL